MNHVITPVYHHIFKLEKQVHRLIGSFIVNVLHSSWETGIFHLAHKKCKLCDAIHKWKKNGLTIVAQQCAAPVKKANVILECINRNVMCKTQEIIVVLY